MGLKLSAKPVSFFELGISQLLQFGGKGAPSISLGGLLSEFAGFRSGDIFTTNFTNRETGFDLRFFLPFLRNAQTYLDVQLEDDSSNKLFMLRYLANYQAGLYLPDIGSEHRSSARFEYHRGSPYFYRHGTFSEGMTLNRRILGDELGPQAHGFYLSFSRSFSPKLEITSDWQFEIRDADTLTQHENANGVRDRLVSSVSLPTERRLLSRLQATYELNPRTRLFFEVAYEHTFHFNFSDEDRDGGRLMVAAKWDLF